MEATNSTGLKKRLSTKLKSLKSNPINTDTERAMESVRINGVSVLSGLHLEKLQELGTRKTVRNGEVSLLSTGVRKAGLDSTRKSTLTQSTSSLARAFP